MRKQVSEQTRVQDKGNMSSIPGASIDWSGGLATPAAGGHDVSNVSKKGSKGGERGCAHAQHNSHVHVITVFMIS